MDGEVERSASQEELILGLNGQSVDWYLQNLVATVNTTTIELGITLFVEGAIVSGLLVSGQRYFETFAREFAGAYPGDEEVRETVRTTLASHADIYKQPDSGEAELPPPQYIHLIDAKCFAPRRAAVA